MWEAGESVLVSSQSSIVMIHRGIFHEKYGGESYCALCGILSCVCDVVAAELRWARVQCAEK